MSVTLHLFLFLIEIWSKPGKLLSMKFGVWIDEHLLYYFLYVWSISSVHFKIFNEEPESQMPSWISLRVWADCCSLFLNRTQPACPTELGRKATWIFKHYFYPHFYQWENQAQNIWRCSDHTGSQILDHIICLYSFPYFTQEQELRLNGKW